MACGDDGSSVDDAGGSTTADGSTTDPGATGSSTSDPMGTDDGTTADPDGSSGEVPEGTAGCGTELPSGANTVEIQVGADTRQYLISVPTGYDPSTPTPLVFAWHGRGGSGSLARAYFGVEGASAGEAIFVYPDGLPLASMGGQTGWDLAPTGYDVAFFDAMLEQVSDGACIDRERVFVTGHSFGGFMSNALSCFRPGEIRAMGSVAGGPPFGACESETVAAWITHGTLDEVVPFSQGEQSRDAMVDRNGCGASEAPIDPAPCVAYDGCSEGLPVVWCAHDETDLQGHMWPRFAGPAIWEFFASLPARG